MLLPFPQDLPIEAIGILIDKLRGKDIPFQTVMNCAWNLLGFAATQVPVKSEAPELIHQHPITDEQAAILLENLIIQFSAQGAADDTRKRNIPWPIIIKILLGVLSVVF